MPEDISKPPAKGVIPINQMFGDDETDTKLLLEMAVAARNFLENFAWCKSIQDSYFGDGYGGIVAVFLFHIEPSREGVDEWLWVVVGDLPSAYLVIDDSSCPSEALEGYIEEMSKWVKLATRGRSSKNVIPVNVPPTLENAELLEGTLKFLQEIIIPAFREAEAVRS